MPDKNKIMKFDYLAYLKNSLVELSKDEYLNQIISLIEELKYNLNYEKEFYYYEEKHISIRRLQIEELIQDLYQLMLSRLFRILVIH